MRKTIATLLVLLLCPALSFAQRYDDYRHGPPPSYDGPRSRDYHSQDRHDHGGHRDHGDDWIVPLAIVGGVLGVMALSQMSSPAPPPPPQRICRDTYNYYDEFGNYLYSRYVDRPCAD